MAWRKLEDTFHSDRKIRKLARELEIPEPHAAGHLVTLWSWALLHAKDGDLTKFDADDIEHGAKWGGQHGKFLHACVKSRLIDSEPDGTILLHNWVKRGGSFAEAQRKRLKSRENNVASSNVQDFPGKSRKIQERPGKSALEENRREENIDTCQTCEPDGSTFDRPTIEENPKTDRDDIQEVWRHYRTHHPKAPKVLKSRRKEYVLIRQRLQDFPIDDLKRAIDGYHRSPWHQGQNEQGRQYLHLDLMMRSVGKVQTGLEMLEKFSGNGGAPRNLLDYRLDGDDVTN